MVEAVVKAVKKRRMEKNFDIVNIEKFSTLPDGQKNGKLKLAQCWLSGRNTAIRLSSKVFPDASAFLDNLNETGVDMLNLKAQSNKSKEEEKADQDEEDEYNKEIGKQLNELDKTNVSTTNEVITINEDESSEKDSDGLPPLADSFDNSFEIQDKRADKNLEFDAADCDAINEAVENADVTETERIDMKRFIQCTLLNNGESIVTDRLLERLIHVKPTSSDRLSRVKDETSSVIQVEKNDATIQLHSLVDLVCVIFKSKYGVSLAIGRCCSFLPPGKTEWCDAIDKESLNDQKCQIRIDVYNIFIPEGEEDKSCYVLAYETLGQLVARGPCVQTLNPTVVKFKIGGEDDHPFGYRLEKDAVCAVMESQYVNLVEMGNENLLGEVSSKSKMTGEKIPYLHVTSREPIFIVDGTQDVVVSSASLDAVHQCPFHFSKKCNFIGNLS